MASHKWLVIGLIVSLGVNIALVGFLAGRASTGGLGPRGMDPTFGFSRLLLHELPEARREALRPLVRQHMASVRPSIREIRTSQRALRGALVAEPFEPAAVAEALADFRAHLTDSQVASHGAFVELAAQLTPDERRLLVNVLRREPRHRRFPHGNRQPDGR